MLGRWDGNRFNLEELHRFPNGPVTVLDQMYWDVLSLWTEFKSGMARYAAQYQAPLAGIGIDTWGVDYGLLDKAGRLLGNPVHYRDARTNGMMERAFEIVSRAEIFRETGLQFIQLNTIFQLYSMRTLGDPQLDAASALLMMPDLFHYWLTGNKVAEYTIASTTQMLRADDRGWAKAMLAKLSLPTDILPDIIQSGTVIGPILPQILDETGLSAEVPVIAVACHDTGSAVAGIPGLDAQSVYLSSGTWSLMGVETRQPIINEKALELNFTNEGGVDGTIRLLKNVTGLWLLQESRRQWEREGMEFTWPRLLAEAEQAAPFPQYCESGCPRVFRALQHGGHDPSLLPAYESAGARVGGRNRALLPGESGAALPVGGRCTGGTAHERRWRARPAPDIDPRRRWWQPEPAAQPVYRRCMPAPGRQRTGGSCNLWDRDDAGGRHRTSGQCSGGTDRHCGFGGAGAL